MTFYLQQLLKIWKIMLGKNKYYALQLTVQMKVHNELS